MTRSSKSNPAQSHPLAHPANAPMGNLFSTSDSFSNFINGTLKFWSIILFTATFIFILGRTYFMVNDQQDRIQTIIDKQDNAIKFNARMDERTIQMEKLMERQQLQLDRLESKIDKYGSNK